MSGKKHVRHSPGQIVEKLQEEDRLLNAGQSLGQVLQALSVSEATYHHWRLRGECDPGRDAGPGPGSRSYNPHYRREHSVVVLRVLGKCLMGKIFQ